MRSLTRLMPPSAMRLIVAASATFALASCEAIVPIPDRTATGGPGPLPDAGVMVFEAGVEAGGLDEAGAPPCLTIFVAPGTGNDTRTGCESSVPVKTLAHAIVRAKAAGAKEIRACAGVFDEPGLLLDAPISLRGGYDCATWQRPAGFGYPQLGGTAETRVVRTDLATVGASTFAVEGAAITRETHIEGLTFDGPTSGSESVALVLRGGASPSVHEVIARGGATARTAGVGAIGMEVRGGGSPEIHRAKIFGGLGTSDVNQAGYGAAGLHISGSSPAVHDCTIDSSSTAVAAIGVLIDGGSKLTGANAFSRNKIEFSKADTVALGLLANGPGDEVEVLDNVIGHGALGCTNTLHACVASAVLIQGGSKATIRRNRIAGGEIPVGATELGSQTTGIFILDAASALVENNQIASGNEAAVTTIQAAGIRAYRTPSLSIRHNTIIGGDGGSYALILADGLPSARVDRNILGGPTGLGIGMFLTSCASPAGTTLASFSGNVFLELSTLVIDNQCGTPVILQDLPAVENSPNIPTPTPTHSSRHTGPLIAGGATKVTLLTTGWKLMAAAPCAVAKPPLVPGVPGVDVDAFGNPRTAPTSTGAHEIEACLP